MPKKPLSSAVTSKSFNSVTTSEKYVKLIFERDTGMKNYAKINALQREFEQNELIPEKKAKTKKPSLYDRIMNL